MKKRSYHEPGDRNGPCHCGSGKKYKKCHLMLEQGYVPLRGGIWKKRNFDAPQTLIK